MSDVFHPDENDPTPEAGQQQTHESIVDATDAPAEPAAGLERAKDELNRAGDNLAKAAAEAAYATIGLVDLVSDRVKEFYADQKRQYSQSHPEFDGPPEAREVLSNFGEQVDRFIGEVGDTFRSLAERGRASSRGGDPADATAVPVDEASQQGVDDVVEAVQDTATAAEEDRTDG